MKKSMGYTEDTKILTEDGWRWVKDLESGCMVHTLDYQGQLCVTPVQKVICEEYSGEVLHLKSSKIDLDIGALQPLFVRTENKSPLHVPAQDVTHKHIFLKGAQIPEIMAEQIVGLPSVVDGGFLKRVVAERYLDTNQFLLFLGLWVTDGSIRLTGRAGNQVRISQVKPSVRAVIDKLLAALDFKYSYSCKSYYMYSKQLFCFLREQFIKNNDPKKGYYVSIPLWIKKMHALHLEHLVKGLMLGDGRLEPNCEYSGYLTTASEALAEDFAEIALKMGRCATIRKKGVGMVHSKQKVPYYFVSLLKPITHYARTTQVLSKFYSGPLYSIFLDGQKPVYIMQKGKTLWGGTNGE